MNNIFKKTYALLAAIMITFVAIDVEAKNTFGIDNAKFNAIENKVNSMNYDQLIATRASLIEEQDNLNNLKDIKNVNLDEFKLRFDDNSILKRLINFYATEVRKTTPNKVKKELATVLTLTTIMTKGLASELTGELSSELIKLINDGGTISIVMQPEKPINLSILTDLQSAERSKEEIGFSAKAE